MYVCESEFNEPDPKNPKIALTEIDCYFQIPEDPRMPNHRLSLRMRFNAKKKWEVYRRYSERVVVPIRFKNELGVVITTTDTKIEEVAFKSESLEEALEFASNEWNKYHGKDGGEIKYDACQHKYPKRSSYCQKDRESM